MVIAIESDMSWTFHHRKNKNKVMEVVKGSALFKAMRVQKFEKGLYPTWRNF